MKITIETTPAELAELVFALVDADFEVDDDEEEDAKTELVNQVVDVLIKNIKTTT